MNVARVLLVDDSASARALLRARLTENGHEVVDVGQAAEAAELALVKAPDAVVTMGGNGPRIHGLLAPLAAEGRFALEAADDLADAVARARRLLGGHGVVLLSPGAPSFGAYRDYTERGRHFAALGGFDPEAISAIPGLGVA